MISLKKRRESTKRSFRFTSCALVAILLSGTISALQARYYSAPTGRFISADTVIQNPSDPQSLNRYAYVRNNPVALNDPSGHFFFVPILIAAAIGAGTSAAVYSAVSLASGNSWNLRNFVQAAAAGAISGAVSGGIGGALSSAFGQNVAFGVLGNMAGMSAATVAQGGSVNAAMLGGAFVGGLVGGAIPGFQGVQGGAVKNIGAELAYSSARGAISGAVSGGVTAAIQGGDVGRGMAAGVRVGAISGATVAGLQIAALGPAYVPSHRYGNFGAYGPVYRTGTFITRAFGGTGSGVTLGRNLVTNQFENDGIGNDYLRAHESYHFMQEAKYGYANFYAKTISDYSNYGFLSSYYTPDTIESNATLFGENWVSEYYLGSSAQ